MRLSRLFWLALIVSPLLFAAEEAEKRPSETQFEIPEWFKSSFLDLKEDVEAAAKENKRLLLYIGQDGCPYCRELMQNNFSQKDIVDYTRRHFDALAINMWGDADVTDFRGNTLTEKQFAEQLQVKYTPTLLFFNEQGDVVLRINGYFPPHQMKAALQYVAEKREGKEGFREYYAKLSPPPASGKLTQEPFFTKTTDFSAKRTKPLAVFFEAKECRDCDILHKKILSQPETRQLLQGAQAAQVDMWANTPVTTPSGKKTTARDWAQELGLVYAPSVVFFDPAGKEVMRIEAMLKTFHVQSAIDYVVSGAYLKQPNFQRYIDERASKLRARGQRVDIWK